MILTTISVQLLALVEDERELLGCVTFRSPTELPHVSVYYLQHRCVWLNCFTNETKAYRLETLLLGCGRTRRCVLVVDNSRVRQILHHYQSLLGIRSSLYYLRLIYIKQIYTKSCS